MKTIKLFHKDVYLKEFESEVTDIYNSCVCLKETAFFPTGGGQPCDLGKLNHISVNEVYEKDGLIWHVLEENPFQKGDAVKGEIDWKRRFKNMQRHCGEHIMSGMWHREYGGVNRGFHMGDDYMTADISFEDDPEYLNCNLTQEMINRIEMLTNRTIWANLPVITRRFDTRKEAASLPLRKTLAIDEEISIVSIGSTDNPSDCVACCGTHPAYSSEVGLFKIYRFEKYKGMWRIFFDAGENAMTDYMEKHSIIQMLGKMFSAGTDDLLDKVNAQERLRADMRNELSALRKLRENSEIQKIEQLISNSKDGSVCHVVYSDIPIDALNNISKYFSGSINRLLVLEHKPSFTLFFVSDGIGDKQCGNIVKDAVNRFSARGGGSKTAARAMFPDNISMCEFLNHIMR